MGDPQLLPFTLFLAPLEPYLENAVEGRPNAIITLQGAVGLDFIVAQTAAPAGTEDRAV